LFAKQLYSQIVKDVANVKCFFGLADETFDDGQAKPLSLSFYFVKNNEFLHFLQFLSPLGKHQRIVY